MIPEGIVTSVFPRVERRLAGVGVGFDRWQRGVGQVALGCRADGKFAASVGGNTMSIPRQVGKTFTVGRILVGLSLEIPGLQVAWTSHHNRTTARTFQSIRALVRRKQIYPLLDHSARSDGTRAANGQEEIRFGNGSLMMFGAREQGFGRGLDEVDVEVFDEAQILTLKALEDMVPAVNQARNPRGGLIFFLGTPPRPTDPGEAFAMKRERALSGESSNIFYVEFSAERGSDPDDRSQWPIMNPSYPLRTPLESMLRMRENIPDDDSWDREARGIWPEHSRHVPPVVSAGRWRELVDAGPADGVKPDALGVDMSHGRDISVGACWLVGATAHLELVWSGGDAAAAAAFIVERAGRRMPVVIDAASPAKSLIPELRARGVKLRGREGSTASDMATACGLFVDRVTAGTLSHDGQRAVAEALSGARKRPIRDAGGFGWDRRDSTDVIHPLVAVTLALLGASDAKRRSGGGSGGGSGFA